MIRFAWLQARTQTAIALGTLAIVAIVLALTGPHLVHLHDAYASTCAAHNSCDPANAAFLRHDRQLRAWLDILVIVVPGIIGLFWGAPLVARELETSTFRLAWTQSITRTRWLACKLGVIAATGMLVAGLFSLMVTWWSSPFDIVNANRFSSPTFDERGIVVIGFAAFAFTLGVAAGTLIRRTVPAMATTLVAFVFTRLAVIQWVRPYYMAPLHRTALLRAGGVSLSSSNGGPLVLAADAPRMANAWISSTRVVDATGHALTPQILQSTCPQIQAIAGPPQGAGAGRTQVPLDVKSTIRDCVAKVSTTFHTVTTYQPANRYWTFQCYELALFLGAALALSGLCFWWIRRRLS